MKFIISILIIININFANANSIGQSTELKLPRFASTKSDESNLRVGPSIDYPIKLTYIIQNTPLEIIDEHEKKATCSRRRSPSCATMPSNH